MPGTNLSALCLLTLLFTTTAWGGHHYYSYLTGKKANTRKSVTCSRSYSQIGKAKTKGGM